MEPSEVLLALLMLITFSVASADVKFPLSSSCPINCGNINIFYPFGIGEGCFRPGFKLTCNYSTALPKLFLGNSTIQVMGLGMPLYSPTITIKTPVVTLDVNKDFSNGSLIDLHNKPYGLKIVEEVDSQGYTSWLSNKLWVVGCSTIAYLIDLENHTRLGSCLTICPADNTSMQASSNKDKILTSCNGIGCCFFDNIPENLNSFAVQLKRINSTSVPLENSTLIKAFISDEDSLTNSDIFRDNEGANVTASLGWYINDQSSCEEAEKKDTYACISSNSICKTILPRGQFPLPKSGIGYVCDCSEGYQGNPYLPNGCQVPNVTVVPKSHCERKCGSIYIPFPFGLEEGCYRDYTFALFCNRTLHPPILLFQYDLIVINISVQKGLMEFTNLSSDDEIFNAFLSYEHYMFQYDGAMVKWVIDYKSCTDAWQNKTTYACRAKYSSCSDVYTTDYENKQLLGYRCGCVAGYFGNPYLENGCADINECEDPKMNSCDGICVNTPGNYTCIPNQKHDFRTGTLLVLGAGIGIGLLLVIASFVILCRKWKKRKAKRLREKFFSQNHGLLLQQLISSTDDMTTNTKIFTLEELEKATNNFDQTRIVGQGGHGTVYKGILSDQRVVAIKKSKISLEREINQFINEVSILSQINHRNIVKLFGCCLETEVPLLVYEFISNGTLSDCLHKSSHESQLSWEYRLRIATEVAGALAYLHSAAYISIFHRDVKSSNIILDEYYTAKVSDFGASRSIPTDQTRVTTAIQGTFGYLDPEYYQTGQLTEKSDVYSFGVILLELLTGKKPICPRGQEKEDMNLAMLFIQAKRENRLLELIDGFIANEDIKEEIDQVFELAEMCLKLKGDERPTMKAVEHKLQALRRKKPHTKEWYGVEKECLDVDDESYAFGEQYYYSDAVTENSSLEMQSM